jgi:hypothetical protein
MAPGIECHLKRDSTGTVNRVVFENLLKFAMTDDCLVPNRVGFYGMVRWVAGYQYLQEDVNIDACGRRLFFASMEGPCLFAVCPCE